MVVEWIVHQLELLEDESHTRGKALAYKALTDPRFAVEAGTALQEALAYEEAVQLVRGYAKESDDPVDIANELAGAGNAFHAEAEREVLTAVNFTLPLDEQNTALAQARRAVAFEKAYRKACETALEANSRLLNYLPLSVPTTKLGRV